MNTQDYSKTWRSSVAMAAHVYTSLGLVAGFYAINAILLGDHRGAFLAMFVAVVIDATDGTLARAVDVKRYTPWINGRKLDDIVDYFNYTLVPVFYVWQQSWLPEPAWLWCAFPLLGSVFAFVHEGAKEEERGFFRGFPSYWNVVAFYLAIFVRPESGWMVLPILVFLGILCVVPVRFVYPNRPPCWKAFFLGGAIAWGTLLLAMLWRFPTVPPTWSLLSLAYPVAYVFASFYLDRLVPNFEQAATIATDSTDVWPEGCEPLGESSEG
ncbi:MAG: hypothetical protein KDB23_19155 [Planctomycetales bacterium]|nr:hypothetical protein [Planctomycetales bacterium]